ncbi:transposase family protein [Clostridioides difficile]|uniref:transposase family protein n=1 Tax=Clostridioides difficile TaxID=1496 RepID=UPI0010BBA2CA|nr:transposase family protein [Clostridioides difficile]MBH7423674.1 transposase family protein [Clostridioides difficile]MBJ8698855.1 transposase family protein [Clostridioides difficile]MCO5863950.1 transposase family protein [Clostridioides difficile]MDE3622879.1 transposase family protein [Clostridioides difficile]MDL0235367.1 transposase family protein [Clostridioides difficile]
MSIKYNNEEFVLVKINDIDKLYEQNIEYIDLKGNFYAIDKNKIGRKKRFTNEMQEQIRTELKNNTIRNIAKKYGTSTETIQNIKNFKY